MKKLVLLLIIVCLFTVSCTTKAQKDLELVNEKYNAGEWQEAIDLADALIEQYPKAEEEINAANEIIEQANHQLDIIAAAEIVADAESEYNAGEFTKAIDTASKAIKDYPDAVDNDAANRIIWDAYIGNIQLKYDAKEYEEAIELANSFTKKYSKSDRIDDAKKLIEDANTAINIQKAVAVLDEIKSLLNQNNYTAVYKKVPEVSQYVSEDSEYVTQANSYLEQAKQIERNSYEKKLDDAYNAGKWKDVQSIAKTIISKYKSTAPSLATKAQNYSDNAKAKLREEEKAEARSLIRVTGLWISGHDYVGGVNVYFNFVNKSSKTIKRVNFAFTFYDKVGDVAKCEIENVTVNSCHYTGPVASGGGLSGTGWCWGKYYNWDIASVKLVSLSIEYMDGTTKSFTKEQIEDVQY